MATTLTIGSGAKAKFWESAWLQGLPRAPPVRRKASERVLSASVAMEEPPGKKGPAMDPAQDSGRDWLSGLPEGVLHRIMSFLDSRQAVRTCVLSRRWRDLWRSVPRVHADICDLIPDRIIDVEGEKAKMVVFNSFINRLLERRDPTASIETFFCRCCIPDEDGNGSADANRWISYGLQKNAWFLEVVMLLKPLELDPSVFSSIYLRRIAFDNVFMDQGFFKQLQMGCPALERFDLDGCIVADDEISSNTLKPHNHSSLVQLTIENNLQWCPKFFNLVGLTLGKWCLNAIFYALIVFLQNSPRLEKPTLILAEDNWKTTEVFIGELEERSFTCEHLTSVEVKCWEDDPLVNNVVDFFVGSGMSSAQIHIEYEDNDEDQFHIESDNMVGFELEDEDED
ncbi:hypothetical protein OsI_32625 [Oryza sativa Indica Group]|uniref:F-box domain-containing protein n=1 Tax=Oryza sativa subsp. indica TaxID=39946 RepID=B8BFF2_ORYSI|nr:hypothetical protein OsI_32625 [Oryza sativa Indica Group]